MVKLTGCTATHCGVGFSLPAGMSIKCNKCGHAEKVTRRSSGQISCPNCASEDVTVTGEKK